MTLLTPLDPWAVVRPSSRYHDRPTPASSTSRDPTPLQKYTFLTLSTLQPHPLATSIMETPLLGPPLFPLNTIVSQLLQVYGDVFAVLTIPVEVRSGRIYNQELNVWNWKTGEHLCVSITVFGLLHQSWEKAGHRLTTLLDALLIGAECSNTDSPSHSVKRASPSSAQQSSWSPSTDRTTTLQPRYTRSTGPPSLPLQRTLPCTRCRWRSSGCYR